jgi:hypothetical protein
MRIRLLSPDTNNKKSKRWGWLLATITGVLLVSILQAHATGLPALSNFNAGNVLHGADLQALLQNVIDLKASVATSTVGTFNVLAYGAKGDGSTNDTVAIQAAIDAAGVSGGVVRFPQGNYLVTSTLTLSHHGVSLEGDGIRTSYITCQTGSSDCIALTPSGGADGAQILGINFRGLDVLGGYMTGGNCLNLTGAVAMTITNVLLDGCYNGLYAIHINGVTMTNGNIANVRGAYAIKFDDDLAARGDVLAIYDSSINCGWSGAEGIVWDGASYTLRIGGLAILQCSNGIHVMNSRGSSIAPESLFADDLEIDGASSHAMLIDGGIMFQITNSALSNTGGGPGANDGDTIVCNADAAHSVTRGLFISNTRIGNSHQRAAYIDCKDVHISGSTFDDASKSGVNSYPVVELGPHASDVQISGGSIGVLYGDALNPSYGVKIDSGADRITLSGIDFSAVNIAELLNGTSGHVLQFGNMATTGNAL